VDICTVESMVACCVGTVPWCICTRLHSVLHPSAPIQILDTLLATTNDFGLVQLATIGDIHEPNYQIIYR
jgi:hypothetical protein